MRSTRGLLWTLLMLLGLSAGPALAQDFGEDVDSGSTAEELMNELIRGASAGERATAAGELAQRSVDEAAPLLITAVRTDPVLSVRVAAVQALEVFRDLGGVEEALRDFAKNAPDEEIKQAARQVLDLLEVDRGAQAAPWSRYKTLDPDQGRMIYGHTAYGAPKGTFTGKAFNFGTWNLKYAINKNLEIGAHVSLPVMFVHLGPFVKTHWKINDWLAIGGFAQVHAVIGYGDLVGWNHVAYGGGPTISFGNPDLNLTIGGFIHGHHMDGASTEAWSVVPTISGAARVHRMVKLILEVWLPLLGEGGEIFEESGELALLFYGIRLFGEKFFGDISFVWPIHKNSGDFMRYMPLGIPILNFGFAL